MAGVAAPVAAAVAAAGTPGPPGRSRAGPSGACSPPTAGRSSSGRRWRGGGSQAQQALHEGAEQEIVDEAQQFVESHHRQAGGGAHQGGPGQQVPLEGQGRGLGGRCGMAEAATGRSGLGPDGGEDFLQDLAGPLLLEVWARAMPIASGSSWGPRASSRIRRRPSRLATMPVSTSSRSVASKRVLTPIGTWQPPSSSRRKARSARQRRAVGVCSSTLICSSTACHPRGIRCPGRPGPRHAGRSTDRSVRGCGRPGRGDPGRRPPGSGSRARRNRVSRGG